MQLSHISDYFHDFTKERTMMLEVFLDNDLRSTAHDHKKEQEKGIHTTPIAMMPSTSVLALPEHGNVFIMRADISRVEISTILMQDGQQHEEVKMDPEKSLLLPTSDSDQARLLLQSNHVVAHARKKLPPDKRQAEESFLRKIKSSFISSSTNTKFKPQESGLPISLDLAKLGITLGP
ncbi:hypothetical protein GW17_00006140 [Ensete ventricosum]|nr:hypothetical protein GW17_00006140 [Ensete ventricosum]